MADICFDSGRHCVLRVSETTKHTIYVSVEKEGKTRKVDVRQLPIQKFNNTYKPETTALNVKGLIEKWTNLVSIGVIISPAAKHVFNDILNPKSAGDETVADTKKDTKKDIKKDTKAKPEAKPEAKPKKEGPKVTLSTKPKKEGPKVTLSTKPKKEASTSDDELPFATAEVRAAPKGSDLKPGKSLVGGEPSHLEPSTSSTSSKGATMATKTSTAKTTTKPEPKKAAKPEPKKAAKPEPKKAAKPEPKKAAEPRVRSSEISDKKIKVNPKADLDVLRKGTILEAQMKLIMSCKTVAEALSKSVKRTDGEKFKIHGGHVKKAVDYGFISLV